MRALSFLSLFVWLSISSHLFSQPLFQVNEKGEITLLCVQIYDDLFFSGQQAKDISVCFNEIIREADVIIEGTLTSVVISFTKDSIPTQVKYGFSLHKSFKGQEFITSDSIILYQNSPSRAWMEKNRSLLIDMGPGVFFLHEMLLNYSFMIFGKYQPDSGQILQTFYIGYNPSYESYQGFYTNQGIAGVGASGQVLSFIETADLYEKILAVEGTEKVIYDNKSFKRSKPAWTKESQEIVDELIEKFDKKLTFWEIRKDYFSYEGLVALEKEVQQAYNEGKIDDRFFDGYEYELLAYVGEVFLRENGGQWLMDSDSKDFNPYGILHLDGTINSGFLSYSFDVIPLYHYGGGLGFTEIYQLMGEND
jgi:hypothetical protein